MNRESDAYSFWEEVYKARPSVTSGRPSNALVHFASSLKPGRSLELGCGKGDDAVWLASKGWTVLATDISDTALDHARNNALKAGVSHLVSFQQADLTDRFPSGRFELVSAMFLESPREFAKGQVLHIAAEAVAPGGTLIATSHASSAPWMWDPSGNIRLNAKEVLESMRLDRADWEFHVVQDIPRLARGPDGTEATVLDAVLVLQRRRPSDI